MSNDVRGIYYILNTLNKKIYIGSSCHINRRFYEHKYFLNKNTHANKHLQSAWNKYGEDVFEFGIIELIDSKKEDLLDVEQIWLDYFQSYDDKNGYNISAYAEGSGGYKVSKETRKKIRKWHIGQKASEKTRKKLSLQRMGELNNFYGKHHSEETKEYLRKIKTGRKLSETHKHKIIKNLRHDGWSDEERNKMREFRIGEKSSNVKLTENEVIDILKSLKNGVYEKTLADKYNISLTQISRIKNRKRWNYLYEKYPELYTT